MMTESPLPAAAAAAPAEAIVELRDVTYAYRLGKRRLEVLRGITRSFAKGGWHCIFGASGSGKTTLLNLIGAMEPPASGSLRVAGVELGSLSRREAARFRARRIGLVFQAYHLLPELSILENVMLPARFAGISAREARARAAALLENVGLKERMRHRPTELSGGEEQRAAIARALVNDPELLLADEPTGNLDGRTGGEILRIFEELRNAPGGRSILMITHNREIAAYADSVSELVDGVLVDPPASPAPLA